MTIQITPKNSGVNPIHAAFKGYIEIVRLMTIQILLTIVVTSESLATHNGNLKIAELLKGPKY